VPLTRHAYISPLLEPPRNMVLQMVP